jgi:hypothetical protein
MRRLPPDIVIDHHEFSVAWRWLEKFGVLQASDVMILEATHPGVPRSLTDIALSHYRPKIEAAMAAHGLSSHDYVTTAAKMDDKLVSLGGNAPGIARNTFGLGGSVSYLIETRGVGIAVQSYQRRVATHYVLAKAVLEASAERGPALRSAIAAARQAAADDRSPLVVSHKVARRAAELPMIDPQTGAVSNMPITLADSRKLIDIEQRSRPRGYLVLRGTAAVGERLALNGVASCTASATAQVAVEAYDMQRVAPSTSAARESINPDQSVKVTLRSASVDVPTGALFVPMNQAAAAIAPAALEPDSPGSYVGVGVVPASDGETEAPVYRVTSDQISCSGR